MSRGEAAADPTGVRTIYIALLRAINVGGHKPIKMDELRHTFEAMGFGTVQTYIQSGNVLFESAEAEAPLRRRIESALAAAFGYPIPVVLRTAAELAQVIGSSPYAVEALPAGASLHVALLAEAPAPAGIDRLRAFDGQPDECQVVGREVFILYRHGSGTSKLTNSLLERRLGVLATSRNWQTINKLVALAQAMQA